MKPMGLIIDSFAGGGGASTGIEMALGRSPDIAINHDAEALAMHQANHPATKHYSKNIWQVDPLEAVGNRAVDLAWFSPDCKHFSKAKGGKPVKASIRDLAWVVVRWAKTVRPRLIMLENVEEFQGWGPLKHNDNGELIPDPERKGETFRRWMGELKRLGYRIEWRELRACDYGSPTIRKRFFMIARRDGCKIVWPKTTHGDPKSEAVQIGELKPWRTAAEIIDWNLPCYSIFLSKEEGRSVGVKRPLEEATMTRIAKGIDRYVINAIKPFIVNLTHQGGDRTEPVDEPFKTVTGAHRGEKAVVSPVIVPTLITSGYGEREGQEPCVPGLEKPLGTAVASGVKHALVAPHLTKFRKNSVGSGLDEPAPTVTANSYIKRPGGAPPIGVVAAFMAQHNIDRGRGHPGRSVEHPVSTVTSSGAQQGVVATHMLNMKGSDRRDSEAGEPVNTITGGGYHIAQVAAFMTKYYGTGEGAAIDEPCHTTTTKDRFGLITVDINGEPYIIADIGMRMLSPRELFRAQGFPDDYIIAPEFNGKPLTKTAQIRMCGNSVCPQVAEALVHANFSAGLTAVRVEKKDTPWEYPLFSEEAAA